MKRTKSEMLLDRVALARCERKAWASSGCLVAQVRSVATFVQLLLPPLIGLSCLLILVVAGQDATAESAPTHRSTSSSSYGGNYNNSDSTNDNNANNNSRQLTSVGSRDVRDSNALFHYSTSAVPNTSSQVQVAPGGQMGSISRSSGSSQQQQQQQSNSIIPAANPNFEAAFQGECNQNRSNNPCEHTCIDLHDGTYECACFYGFALAVDGYSCTRQAIYRQANTNATAAEPSGPNQTARTKLPTTALIISGATDETTTTTSTTTTSTMPPPTFGTKNYGTLLAAIRGGNWPLDQVDGTGDLRPTRAPSVGPNDRGSPPATQTTPTAAAASTTPGPDSSGPSGANVVGGRHSAEAKSRQSDSRPNPAAESFIAGRKLTYDQLGAQSLPYSSLSSSSPSPSSPPSSSATERPFERRAEATGRNGDTRDANNGQPEGNAELEGGEVVLERVGQAKETNGRRNRNSIREAGGGTTNRLDKLAVYKLGLNKHDDDDERAGDEDQDNGGDGEELAELHGTDISFALGNGIEAGNESRDGPPDFRLGQGGGGSGGGPLFGGRRGGEDEVEAEDENDVDAGQGGADTNADSPEADFNVWRKQSTRVEAMQAKAEPAPRPAAPRLRPARPQAKQTALGSAQGEPPDEAQDKHDGDGDGDGDNGRDQADCEGESDYNKGGDEAEADRVDVEGNEDVADRQQVKDNGEDSGQKDFKWYKYETSLNMDTGDDVNDNNNNNNNNNSGENNNGDEHVTLIEFARTDSSNSSDSIGVKRGRPKRFGGGESIALAKRKRHQQDDERQQEGQNKNVRSLVRQTKSAQSRRQLLRRRRHRRLSKTNRANTKDENVDDNNNNIKQDWPPENSESPPLVSRLGRKQDENEAIGDYGRADLSIGQSVISGNNSGESGRAKAAEAPTKEPASDEDQRTALGDDNGELRRGLDYDLGVLEGLVDKTMGDYYAGMNVIGDSRRMRRSTCPDEHGRRRPDAWHELANGVWAPNRWA